LDKGFAALRDGVGASISAVRKENVTAVLNGAASRLDGNSAVRGDSVSARIIRNAVNHFLSCGLAGVGINFSSNADFAGGYDEYGEHSNKKGKHGE